MVGIFRKPWVFEGRSNAQSNWKIAEQGRLMGGKKLVLGYWECNTNRRNMAGENFGKWLEM